jgi:hypothetical protein
MARDFSNESAVDMQLTLIGEGDPRLPVCIVDVAAAACVDVFTLPAGEMGTVTIIIRSEGLEPGMTLDLSGPGMAWSVAEGGE